VLVRGRIDDSDKGRVVLVEEVKSLDDATIAAVRANGNGSEGSSHGEPGLVASGSGREASAHTCRLKVRPGPTGADQMLAAVRQICEAHPGSTPLFVHVLLAEQEVVVRAKGFAVEPAAELVAKVEALLGPGSILVEYAGRS